MKAGEQDAGLGATDVGPHVPGEVGAWVFIFGEMLVFATLFVTFLHYRAKDPALFEVSQRTLNQTSGAILTLVLLSASFLVVMAVRAERRGLAQMAQRFLLGALICGLAFSVLKFLEYHEKLGHHITPETNDFYMLYFVLTGLHWAHVIVGSAVLGILYRRTGRGNPSPHRLAFIEGGACYWHMVDVLWIVLFPLLYLVR